MHELVESHEYSADLGGFNDIKQLDDVLLGISWAISKKPSVFDVVFKHPEYGDMFLAKSEPIKWGDRNVVARVWFTIRDDDHVDLRRLNMRDVTEF